MNEKEPRLPVHPSEVARFEFEPGLNDAEQVAVVCAYVIDALVDVQNLDDDTLTEIRCCLNDICLCETIEEAMGSMASLADYTEGDYDVFFEALAVAGLVEGVEPGNPQISHEQSVLLERNLLQLPATS